MQNMKINKRKRFKLKWFLVFFQYGMSQNLANFDTQHSGNTEFFVNVSQSQPHDSAVT